jgi:hypothetical protein
MRIERRVWKMASRPWTIAWVVTVMSVVTAAGVSAEPWTHAYVDALPDEAFAVVHVRPDGTRARHLPHHDADGRVDLPHVRNALARLNQVRWEDPADAERARQHLLQHSEALDVRRLHPADGADGHSR